MGALGRTATWMSRREEERLWEAWLVGREERARTLLLERYHAVVVRTAAMVNPPGRDWKDDLTSRGLVVLVRAFDNYLPRPGNQPVAQFRNYLIRALRREMARERFTLERNEAREPLILNVPLSPAEPDVPLADRLAIARAEEEPLARLLGMEEALEAQRQVRLLLRYLPRQDALLLRLRYGRNLSQKEIAAEQGWALTDVRRRVNQLQARIQDLVRLEGWADA